MRRFFDELGREGWIYFAKHLYEKDKERKGGLGFMRYVSDGKPAFTVDYKIGNGNLVDGATRKIYADKVGDRFLTATERRDLYLDCWYERINELGEEGWRVPQTETLQFLSGMGMRLVWKLEPANGIN
ncbi:MAG: hypothetical protein U5N86_05040 [Planctomycetota bacterium]|nr:hypothetical protein [Planctomycetota bacterium]